MKRLFFLFSLLTLPLMADPTPKRVYVDMVGDLMHSGHVAMFQKARSYGDYLVVGVHSDAEVESYKRVPIMTMEERIAVISACRYVDEVIPNAPLVLTKDYIQNHHLDLVIHGNDISEETAKKWYGAAIELGIFQMVPYTNGISTTDLIQRILSRYAHE